MLQTTYLRTQIYTQQIFIYVRGNRKGFKIFKMFYFCRKALLGIDIGISNRTHTIYSLRARQCCICLFPQFYTRPILQVLTCIPRTTPATKTLIDNNQSDRVAGTIILDFYCRLLYYGYKGRSLQFVSFVCRHKFNIGFTLLGNSVHSPIKT